MTSTMRISLAGLFLVAVLTLCKCPPVNAQDVPVALEYRAHWIFDTNYGSEPIFGFNSGATSFGPSVEYSVTKGLELQGNLKITPSEPITIPTATRGHLFGVGGSGIGWINQRIGLSLGAQQSWIWASHFKEWYWNPSLGMALRDYFHRPGRLYVSYLFPQGCSGGVSCPSPLPRMQGIQSIQEFRLFRHFRLGLEGGMYHYCGNTMNGRECQFSPAGQVLMRFEFSSADAQTRY